MWHVQVSKQPRHPPNQVITTCFMLLHLRPWHHCLCSCRRMQKMVQLQSANMVNKMRVAGDVRWMCRVLRCVLIGSFIVFRIISVWCVCICNVKQSYIVYVSLCGCTHVLYMLCTCIHVHLCMYAYGCVCMYFSCTYMCMYYAYAKSKLIYMYLCVYVYSCVCVSACNGCVRVSLCVMIHVYCYQLCYSLHIYRGNLKSLLLVCEYIW